MSVLFVTNGHGEIAVANRLAQELRVLRPALQIDHLPLVGESASTVMNEVGPRRAMPSGGLIAMGQFGNIARDVRGGLIALTLAQRRFLVGARARYEHAVAIGDVYALIMALALRTPTTYVGTAKSVRVAPYGPMERAVLRRAKAVYVRDDETATRLREQGVDAQSPGNTIVDLFAEADDPRADEALAQFSPALAIFPGSRESAYDDGAFLLEVLRGCANEEATIGAAFSVAPLLDARRFAREVRELGFDIDESDDERMPFSVRIGERTIARAWRGAIGPLLSRVQLVIGQAGTANEAAAAAGVAVIAFERGGDKKTAWYRMRQHGLLGDALAVLPGAVEPGARGVLDLLHDDARRARMGAVGRERMGAPGGTRAIAKAIAQAVA